MKTFKTRHQFYLPDDLSAKLDALTANPGTSKTQILTDALNAWLDRKGAQELDQRFGPRLDRQNRTAERLERKVDVLTEMLGVFILHQLTLVAHQPRSTAIPPVSARPAISGSWNWSRGGWCGLAAAKRQPLRNGRNSHEPWPIARAHHGPDQGCLPHSRRGVLKGGIIH